MPLLSVYNHLMQGLIMMRPNRFDSHKKSELQNVYRDIMRLTSEQPLYKVTFDESAQEYTLGIKNAALSLSAMVKELNTDDGASVFKNQILVSDRPEDVDVSVLEGSALPDEDLPLSVEVSTLSSPQENHGNYVPSGESELVSGQYNFTIGIEENLYSFQFNVTGGSTNLELQKKLADFINKTSIGLRTRIVQEKEIITSDLHAIRADFLIENIDLAFEVWKKYHWCSRLTEQEFCRLILPYRIKNEPLEDWRNFYYHKYKDVADSLAAAGVTMQEVVFFFNTHYGKRYTHDAEKYRGDLSYKLIEEIGGGTCDHQARGWRYSCHRIGDELQFVKSRLHECREFVNI